MMLSMLLFFFVEFVVAVDIFDVVVELEVVVFKVVVVFWFLIVLCCKLLFIFILLFIFLLDVSHFPFPKSGHFH